MRRVRKTLVLAIVGCLLVAAAAAVYFGRTKQGQSARSMAVLPFVNATADPKNEYLSDGLTEGLIGTLSQLPDMKVMARTTAFRYKANQDDPQKIGQDLHVGALLVGRVTHEGDELGVQADLVNAADGTELWGAHYHRKPDDFMQVQSDITRDVVNHLRVRLSEVQSQEISRPGTSNPEAYRLYLQGRQLWYGRTAEGLKKSIELFQQAIAADPNYALAYSGLADTYNVSPSYGIGISARQGRLLADEAARKALELDDSLSEAHAAKGMALGLAWQWKEAEAQLQRAIQLNPGNSSAHYFYAISVLLPQKRTAEAAREYQSALSLDPLSSIIGANYAMCMLESARYSDAIAQLQKIAARDPNFTPAHLKLAQVYAASGNFGQAVSEMHKVVTRSVNATPDAKGYVQMTLALDPEASNTASITAAAYAVSGDRDRAFEYLEKAYNTEDTELFWVVRYPSLDLLRADPRFVDLMRRLNLPQ